MRHIGSGALCAILLAGRAARADNDLPPEEAKPVAPTGVVIPVSIVGGLRAEGAFKMGDVAPNAANNPNGVLAGVDLALEVGTLVWNHFYGGVLLGGTFFVSPQDTTASVSSLLLGTELGYLTSPEGLGAFFGVGVGYRAVFVSDSLGNANKFDGPDALFTFGLQIKVASYLRLMPRVDLSLGPTDGADAHLLVNVGISAWLNADVHPKRRAGH
jgi:hypothetical protein